VLEAAEICGRYMEGTGPLAVAKMGGHDVAYCLETFAVSSVVRTWV
jgi:hypothetical protein